MPGAVYLAVMLGIIILIAVWVVPSVIRKRCPKCGTRNSLDAVACVTCDARFPVDS
jgi:hypothetical protein